MRQKSGIPAALGEHAPAAVQTAHAQAGDISDVETLLAEVRELSAELRRRLTELEEIFGRSSG